MSATHRYPYRSSWLMTIAGILLFGYAAPAAFNDALHHHGPAVIHGIHFEEHGARIAFGILASLSAVLLLASLFAAYQRLFHAREFIIGPSSFTYPAFRGPVEVPYGAITGFRMRQQRRIRFLTILHEEGKVVIIDRLLPKNTFEDIVQVLRQRSSIR